MWTAETVLVCALALLTRGADSFAPIKLIDTRPAHVSPAAEAFVLLGEPRIYLLTTTAAFEQARRAAYRCGEVQALRKIASVIIHEDWHVRHGDDEAGAYQAQLVALMSLNAGPGSPLYQEVRRSMKAVLTKTRRDQEGE